MTAAPPEHRGSGSRMPSLDGLRGLAALVVVLHHAAQVSPDTDRALAGESATGSLSWWLTWTPAHLLWLGEEAVLVFFVLSGFVLALPATRRRLSWTAYYPRRLLRLYVPVWGSVVLAVVLALLVPRVAEPGSSTYLVDRAQASIADAGSEGLLLLTDDWRLNGPLWSLRWELVFSLLLPLYLVAARWLHRSFVGSVAVVLGVLAIGAASGSSGAYYLPVFALGVLMAYHRPQLARWGDGLRLAQHGAQAFAALGVLAVLLLTARWTSAAAAVDTPLDTAAPVLGACLVVFLALHWPSLAVLLRTSPLQWLGRCSFSLYVIHEPIILTTAYLLPVELAWSAAGLGAGVAVLAAGTFYARVEAPSLAWARQVGAVTGTWGARGLAMSGFSNADDRRPPHA